MDTQRISIVRLAARILSVMLFLLWGAFFIEHLSWFTAIGGSAPPAKVWLLQAVHFLLLVGYLVSLKWEKVGSIIVVISAVIFFSAAAGINAIPFVIVSVFPVLLFMYCWMKGDNKPATPVVK